MAEVTERAGAMFTRAKRRIGIENPSAAEDEGNVGIVRGALRAFGAGEFDQFLDALKEDVTWEAPGGNFPGGDMLEGRDEVRGKYIDTTFRTYTEFGFIPESFLDAGDDNAVVVFGRFAGDGVDGGSVDVAAVQVWQFKGTEAEFVRIYTDSAEFPEAITEEKERQRREEEKKQREEEEKKEREETEGKSDDDDSDDSKDSDDSDDSGGSEPEAKSDSDSDSDSEDDSGDSEKSS
jgi:ketosteroid isomerase-like protein